MASYNLYGYGFVPVNGAQVWVKNTAIRPKEPVLDHAKPVDDRIEQQPRLVLKLAPAPADKAKKTIEKRELHKQAKALEKYYMDEYWQDLQNWESRSQNERDQVMLLPA
jgi:hypothetical protein